MEVGVKVGIEVLRSLAFGSIGAAYMGIGDSIDNPARIVIINNSTDADLLFSDDGVNDKFFISKYSALILDVSANKTVVDGLFFEKGSRFYVKQLGSPSTGSVYLSAFYGINE